MLSGHDVRFGPGSIGRSRFGRGTLGRGSLGLGSLGLGSFLRNKYFQSGIFCYIINLSERIHFPT